jgi:hypothetical protein
VTEDLTARVLANIQEQLVEIRTEMREFRRDVDERFDRVDKRFDDMGREFGRRIDQTNRTLLVVEARLTTEISGLRANVLEIDSGVSRD